MSYADALSHSGVHLSMFNWHGICLFLQDGVVEVMGQSLVLFREEANQFKHLLQQISDH